MDLTNGRKIVTSGQTVTLNLGEADFNSRAISRQITTANRGNKGPAVIKLTIKAKIKDKADLTKYVVNGQIKVPNKATVELNGKPQTSNTVYVTPDEPAPSKKINSKHDVLHTTKSSEAFEFNIQTKLPRDIKSYKSYKITDKLDSRLELTNSPAPYVKEPYAQHFDVTHDAATNTVTATAKATSLSTLTGGEMVELVIPAKIKDGTSVEEIPNTSKIVYETPTSGGEKETPPTPPVVVTPPPLIEKQVNAKQHADLTKRDEVFEYTIKSSVPKGAETFEITDELDEALEFAGNQGDVVVKIADTAVTDKVEVTRTGRNLGIKFTKEQLTADAGKTIVITFKAKIRGDVNLSVDKYTQDGTIKVPNKAKYTLNNNPKESNTVTVTPPTPTPPTVEKKVNDKVHETLGQRNQTFDYSIATQVPTDAKSFVITDELKEVLEFVGKDGKNDVTVKIGETDVTNSTTVKIENRTLTVSLTDNQLAKYQGQKVLVTFKAKIVANADLTAYTANGTTKVPNTANFVINNDFTTKKETEPVTVTPPGETPTPKKTVNDKQAEKLSNLDEVFTYKVTAEVPKNTAGFTKFELSDDLEDILTITETGVTVGDATLDKGMTVTSPKDANADSGKVTAALPTNEISKYAGKTVVLTIKARIKEGVQSFELAKYITADNQGGSIPNKATLTVGDKPDQKKDSNNVPVTPPSEDPTVTKKINDKLEHLDTETATNYTYNIKTKLPADITTYKKFVISDELDAELAVQGKPVISGPAAQFFDVKVEGQLVTATMKNFVTAQELAGKEVELVIVSQIRKGVTTQNIPNIARITYQNRTHAAGTPDSKKDTPPVTVTPPGETPTVEKKINKDLTEATVLPESNYTYNITSLLPVDITRYKAYAIVDELDENLAIQGTPVMAKIDGVDMTQFFDVKVAGQKVTATMKNFENAAALAGKKVELVITAQVKSTSKAPKIDNTAKVTYQNKSHVDGTPDSETPPTPPVTVTPPPVTKKINETLDHLDTATKTNYNYNIKTVLPSDIASYKTFVINDDLDKDLEVQGTPIIKGDAAKFFKVTVDGQKVRATITDFNAAKAYAGKEVELVIVSQIREGVTRQAIPNQTTITYTNKVKAGGEPGDTTTTPPTPPVTVTPPGETPTVEKKINKDLTEATVLPESNYTYNITSLLPVDITRYKAYAIVDELDENLAIQGTPVMAKIDGVDMTQFFDVKVAGQKVTATMKNFENAAALAGKKVELVITAQVKSTSKAPKIDNTAKVTYQNKNHVDGEPDRETPPTPPVTVTPPPVTKKINETLDHLDTATKTNYNYNIKTVLPTDIASYKTFVINDDLDKDLEVQGTPIIKGDAAKFFKVTVDGQKVRATITDFNAAKAYAGKEVELVIVSQIREGVTRQAIPNQTTITYTNKVKAGGEPGDTTTTPPTPPVTVTPPGETPTVEKKINKDLTEATVLPESNYTYNITSLLPVDITRYKAYAIVDELDENLAIQGTPVMAKIDGVDMTQFFDVKVAGQKVTATMKNFKDAAALAGKKVELVITAQVKATSTAAKIDNTAKVTYQNKNHVDGEPDSETPPTPPVTVTTPPVTKKINENLDHLDTATQTNYTYNIKTVLPTDIATYKRFVITDSLESELAVQGIPTMTGDAAKFFDVKVEGQVVTATITDFEAAKAMAGKEVELVIVSQIREGVTRQAIPNQTTISYTNKAKADGTPGDVTTTPPTPPVTVTPPGDTPTVEKKINRDLTEAVVLPESNYTYNITSTLPVDITSYKAYAIVDELDENLSIQGTPVVTGDAAKFFDVTVTGNTVKATMKDFKQAKDLAGKQVELVITAQVKSTSTATKIDNTAKVTYQNKNHVDGEPDSETPPTPPVTVTTPPVTKKINENLDHLDTATQTNYTYNIKTVLPTDIATYKRFAITDSLEGELAVQGIPTMTGDAAKFFDVKVDGQVVTATITDFEAAKAMAGKEVELVIVSQIREGVTRQAIPNQTTISYTNKAKADGTPGDVTTTPPTPPVTVTPPGETPTVEKKINRDLTEAVVLPESNYTYNITSTLPVDITSYKAYAIVDELDENLSIQGTPVVTGDAAKFFDVTVTGNTVKATMKDFKQAKDLAGKQVELVITAQVKSTSTATKIDNTAKVTYQNKNHVDGEPDSETPPTPPVTVTTPPVTKKINENLDHLDTATQTNYTYNIKTVLPTDIATYKRFVITDSLEGELAVQGIPTMTGDAAKFFDVKVDGQVVTATITDFEAAKAMAGKEVELVIVSQIREGVTRQAIPNQTTISYTNKAKADGTPGDVTTTPPTPPVTVTPPGETPTVEKKINRDLTEAVVLPESNYTYNITSTLPVDITSYKAYAIVDELDENLSIQGTPVVTGDAAKFFDVTVTGNTVKATMKDFKQVKDLAGKQVELVITAQVKSTSTATKIDNTAKVTYQNKNHVDGEPDSETPPTPPVTVTTPPVTKKINENLDHLDTATQTNYTYNIKTVLPTDIANYKRFVITDSLEGELAVQGIPTMTGDAAKFFDVKVDGQVVTATITDFEAAKAMAGKEVELVIVSQIREGVTRQAIPNQTTISYTNKAKADGTPGDVTTTPPTPPVTVTPPGETPTVEKKINRDLEHLDIETEKDYNYNITTNLPVDIVSYKRYVLTDTLDQDLAIQGTPVITGEAAKFFDVTVEGQTVTATMKDFKQAKDLAGKQVELVITAQVREGITRPNIPNTAKVEFTNKSDQTGEKETKPVTVTPPTPNTPPIEKKVNGAASAELASRQEVFTYTIDTVVPTGAFAFEVNDTLEDVLAFEGEVTATLAGKALSTNQITVAGQTVTVKLTKEQVRQQAGAPLQVVFFAKVKDGADLTPYMTDGRTSVPNTASYIINNDPSTKKDSNTVPVYPPTPNEPSVDKKINRDLTHLDVEVNKSYMYNVTADLPQDIATYKEFVVTDIVEPVLAINGEVVAYVDGYATDAVKVTVEGNRVVASVVDFSRLAGFKQIQLYIPAYIKSDADLTAYMKDNAASIPNTASLDFTDSNGVKKRKETTPVTVTPPTPDTPPTPPVNPPQPGTPVKTVSRVAGLEQTDYLALLLATENFRFDIKSVVPMDEADDKRLNLTSLTITDQMDNLFTVSPDKVAVKVTNAPTANANYIDEDVEKAQAALDVEVAKLEEIKQSAQTDTSAAALTEAQNLLATLEAEWTAAEAKLAELTTAELTEAPVETPAVDYASEIAAQEALMAELQAKLDEAKTQVQTAQAALSTAKTAAEVKVEVENQEKVVAEKQTVLDEAKKRQAIVQERIAQLANVNEKGELTAQAIVALGGSIKVEGQLVTVDFTDEYTMKALKGYTVNVIIYSSISDVDALTKDHFTIGIDNTATVQFNHDPSEQLTKKTNKVTVVPPKNDTPPPPPTTPEKPKGELPTPPTPPTTPPAESTPPPPGKTLPKTGVAENGMYALVGMILGTLTLVFRRRKQ
ncbi:isopeptide-forming domain-containing fimbrial protein [Streptococcus suis]